MALNLEMCKAKPMNLLSHKQFSAALDALRSGFVIAIKTDTLYALSCDAHNKEVVNKIFLLKQRRAEDALPILVSNIEQAQRYGEFNELASRMAAKFWPGPLTIVLKSLGTLPLQVQGSSANIAIRAPNDDAILKLIEDLGRPIIGTSANLTGESDILIAEDLYKKFGADLVILDSGLAHSTFGQHSTVVDCTSSQLRVIRSGAIAEDDLCG